MSHKRRSLATDFTGRQGYNTPVTPPQYLMLQSPTQIPPLQLAPLQHPTFYYSPLQQPPRQPVPRQLSQLQLSPLHPSSPHRSPKHQGSASIDQQRQYEEPATTGPKTASRVFDITELFEMILLQMDERTLLLSQRVNRRFRQVIQATPSLRRKLMFDPAKEVAELKLNPILADPAMWTRLPIYVHRDAKNKFWLHGSPRGLSDRQYQRLFISSIEINTTTVQLERLRSFTSVFRPLSSTINLWYAYGINRHGSYVDPALPDICELGSWQDMLLCQPACRVIWKVTRYYDAMKFARGAFTCEWSNGPMSKLMPDTELLQLHEIQAEYRTREERHRLKKICCPKKKEKSIEV